MLHTTMIPRVSTKTPRKMKTSWIKRWTKQKEKKVGPFLNLQIMSKMCCRGGLACPPCASGSCSKLHNCHCYHSAATLITTGEAEKTKTVWSLSSNDSKDSERGTANRMISGNERTNSWALTSSWVPCSSAQFRSGQTLCLLSVTPTKNWLVSYDNSGFQDLE